MQRSERLPLLVRSWDLSHPRQASPGPHLPSALPLHTTQNLTCLTRESLPLPTHRNIFLWGCPLNGPGLTDDPNELHFSGVSPSRRQKPQNSRRLLPRSSSYRRNPSPSVRIILAFIWLGRAAVDPDLSALFEINLPPRGSGRPRTASWLPERPRRFVYSNYWRSTSHYCSGRVPSFSYTALVSPCSRPHVNEFGRWEWKNIGNNRPIRQIYIKSCLYTDSPYIFHGINCKRGYA